MKTRELLIKTQAMRVVVLFLALILAYGAVSYAPHAATQNSLHSVDLGGVTGAANNTILAYGRYVLIAPFWPSAGIAENGDLDVSVLDNHSLYMIDTKKPDLPPVAKNLSTWDSKLGAPKTVYFPSKIVFDPNSNNLYLRGTRFEEHDGEVTAIDVIAYVRLILDDKGRADFDTNVVTIDIQGVGSQYTNQAPLDFGVSAKGDILIFTNGASVFSFNLVEGYLNRVDVVSPEDYNSNNSISFLGVDPTTNIVSVCQNEKWNGKDTLARVSSHLSFFSLGDHGEFDLLKKSSGLSQEGTALVDGGNIEVVSDGDTLFALLATNDGSVCKVDLTGEDQVGTIDRLYSFPELALSSITDPNSLLVHFDSTKRIIGVVKPGFTIQITRPLNGKPGRITRPINLHIASETPVLALAKLNKRYKATGGVSFIQQFQDEGGLANLVIGSDSQWLISTYSGQVYSVGIGAAIEQSDLKLLGAIGSRVDRFDYYADRTSIAAISAFTLDEDGLRIAAPGAVVFGKMSDLRSQPESMLQALLPTVSILGKSTPSIRRPCNLRR